MLQSKPQCNMYHVSSLILNTCIKFKTDKNEPIRRELSLLILAGLCYEEWKHCDIIICS